MNTEEELQDGGGGEPAEDFQRIRFFNFFNFFIFLNFLNIFCYNPCLPFMAIFKKTLHIC